MHPQAKKLLADEATNPGLRRTVVMTAVIMGFPVEGVSGSDLDYARGGAAPSSLWPSLPLSNLGAFLSRIA